MLGTNIGKVEHKRRFLQEHEATVAFAKQLEAAGCSILTVHGRTRNQAGKTGRQCRVLADWTKIAAVKRALRIPVIANGDIVDIPSAVSTMRYTGCSGLMIGRGAIRNPWLFHQIWQHQNGETPVVVDSLEKRRVLLGYFENIRDRFQNDHGALGRFKKIAPCCLPLG